METSKLLFALKLAQPCVVNVDLIPVLQHFCFEEKRLFAYDEVSAIVVGLETGLHCALRADTLLAQLALAGKKVELKAGKDGKVTFNTSAAKIDLPSLPPEDFTFEEPRTVEKSTMRFKATEGLLDALQLCTAGVGKDPRFKAQTAVTVVTGDAPALYAFDGTSLVKVIPNEAIGSEERQVQIPKSICDQIKGVIDALELKPEDVTVNLSKHHLSVEFKHDDWSVYLVGKLLAEKVEVEAYERAVTEAHGGKKLVPIDEEFERAVDRVAIVVVNEAEKVCSLTLQDGELKVHGEGALGVANTVLQGLDGQKAKAAVDPERLTRYRGRLSHIAVEADRIAMYDAKKVNDARLIFITACYA